MLCTHRLKTRISFSSESSLPFKAFLSMTFMAYRSPGLSLLSANLTCEKAPLKNSSIYYMYIYFICIYNSILVYIFLETYRKGSYQLHCFLPKITCQHIQSSSYMKNTGYNIKDKNNFERVVVCNFKILCVVIYLVFLYSSTLGQIINPEVEDLALLLKYL